MAVLASFWWDAVVDRDPLSNPLLAAVGLALLLLGLAGVAVAAEQGQDNPAGGDEGGAANK